MTSNSCASAALKIVVTGATGFIGGRLIASTKLRECELLPVIRSKEKAALLGIDKWILFQELTQKSIVDAGFESSVIVHLIGSSRDEEGCSLRESIVATTEAVVTVARETRSKRVLYLSGYGITPDSSDAYFKSKAEAEKIIQDSGIPYTLFRPSYILGPGDELTPYLVQELEKGSIEIPGDGSYRLQPVYVEDMVDIIINAGHVTDNESYSYDILGPVISLSGYVRMLAARVAPQATFRYEKLETLIRRATFSADPILTTGELAILICDLVGPVTESCLGVRIRSLEETLDGWINQTAS